MLGRCAGGCAKSKSASICRMPASTMASPAIRRNGYELHRTIVASCRAFLSHVEEAPKNRDRTTLEFRCVNGLRLQASWEQSQCANTAETVTQFSQRREIFVQSPATTWCVTGDHLRSICATTAQSVRPSKKRSEKKAPDVVVDAALSSGLQAFAAAQHPSRLPRRKHFAQ